MIRSMSCSMLLPILHLSKALTDLPYKHSGHLYSYHIMLYSTPERKSFWMYKNMVYEAS